jgi:hypothetical protein
MLTQYGTAWSAIVLDACLVEVARSQDAATLNHSSVEVNRS